MTWIKRNLLFVIGGVLALVLLGAAGIYDYSSWRRNSVAFDKLNEVYNTLRTLTNQKPSPGNDRINNVETAKEQEAQLRDWINRSRHYFQPITPIPNPTNGPISNESFADALHRTIDQLRREAPNANVGLQPQYSFSFEAQSSRVKFAPGSLDLLAVQLGEVKAIAEILFAGRINQLDGIQRLRVSDDDTSGPQADYLIDNSVTTDLAVMTPYTVTFRAFSPEIGQTLAGFASSPNGFVVKSINVQPAGAATTDMLQGVGGVRSSGPASPPGKGGLQTVLQEQLLRVTLEVEIVKLLPKK